MSTCLGMYIEENLIKYAKVSKERDQIKVESFGVKFYDNLDKAIEQVIEETYSYKIPISINLVDEKYNYFDVFGQLNKKDIDGIIKTNFENYCYDNGLNKLIHVKGNNTFFIPFVNDFIIKIDKDNNKIYVSDMVKDLMK